MHHDGRHAHRCSTNPSARPSSSAYPGSGCEGCSRPWPCLPAPPVGMPRCSRRRWDIPSLQRVLDLYLHVSSPVSQLEVLGKPPKVGARMASWQDARATSPFFPTPHLIAKAEPGHPAEKANFSLYFEIFAQQTHLLEKWNAAGIVWVFFFNQHNGSMFLMRFCMSGMLYILLIITIRACF